MSALCGVSLYNSVTELVNKNMGTTVMVKNVPNVGYL
jgi:hypothetical protein